MKTHECLDRIARVDEKLDILRTGWMEAAPARKAHWMGQINDALDERLRLMAWRDSVPVPA